MPRTPKARTKSPAAAKHEITTVAEHACLIARDSAANMVEFLSHGSRMAYLAMKDCEKELDQVEQNIDEQLPAAIAQVGEARARELLASLRFVTELERIGDLILWVAHRLHTSPIRLADVDNEELQEMARILHSMLDIMYQGFTQRDLSKAGTVLRMDCDMDRLRHSFFKRHLSGRKTQDMTLPIAVLLMAQALERAGDHATNLAEELYHLVEGRSRRHPPKRKTES